MSQKKTKEAEMAERIASRLTDLYVLPDSFFSDRQSNAVAADIALKKIERESLVRRDSIKDEFTNLLILLDKWITSGILENEHDLDSALQALKTKIMNQE